MKKSYLVLVITLFCAFALNAQKQITMEDIWAKGTFRAKRISEIRSMKDGENYCILNATGIDKYSYKTGLKVGTIVDFSNINEFKSVSNYSFSSNETKLLVTTNSAPIYRHSFTAEYYIYDIPSMKLEKLSEKGKQNLAEFSPDGKRVAFLRDNNMFIKELESGKEIQITEDGKFNSIIYGATDWVYEEEFVISKGFYWSEGGSELAFYRFDESKVKEFSFTLWGKLYPEEYKYKYPKAGENNSVVDIMVYNIASGKTTKLNLGSENDQYLPRMQWTKEENKLTVQRMNRLQNKLEILLANTAANTIQVLYTETNANYVDEPSGLFFLNDKKHFIHLSEKNGYKHIYMYDLTGKEPEKQITTGNFEVTGCNFIDEKNKMIFFTSVESSPINRELYSIDFNGKKKTRISKNIGTNLVDFSNTGKYYINNYSTANMPSYYTINNQKGEELVVLEDNRDLKAKMQEYGAEKKEFASFKTSTGNELNYFIIKPANFDSTKQYPILFYVYGGPGSQTVENAFDAGNYFWFRSLAQKGYVVISVDNRGTGFRGQDFKKCTYRELGKYETEDQIEAAKYFGSQQWANKTRIGIFGWSFGGYMSTLCITKGADYFKTAIAVAPVTNWRYYDNIYTERYMGLPKDNASGYDSNSPISHVAKLKGNYFLIHGSADDNVHVQNAMDLSTALINANKPYEMFIYPNKNHGIYGGYTRLHLYNMMSNFILEKL